MCLTLKPRRRCTSWYESKRYTWPRQMVSPVSLGEWICSCWDFRKFWCNLVYPGAWGEADFLLVFQAPCHSEPISAQSDPGFANGHRRGFLFYLPREAGWNGAVWNSLGSVRLWTWFRSYIGTRLIIFAYVGHVRSLSESSQAVCFVHGPLLAWILNAWKGSERAACRVRRPLLRRLCAQPLVDQYLEET